MTSTPFDLLANRMSGKPVRLSPTVELGTSGLKQSGGYITDEFLIQLQGQPGVKLYREMRDNSPIIGSIMFAIEMLARETGWRIEPHEEGDESDALFVDACLNDMSVSWDETLGEILSCLTYGFQVSELVYKRRQGEIKGKPGASSQYTDGKLGWRKWAPRSQLTIWRWQFDETGGIRGVEQYDPYFAPTTKGFVVLPIEKILLFRPFTYLNNPQGRSILRNAYTSYHYATRIAEIEAIGIERDLAGLPVVKVPAEVMDNETQMEKWRKLVQDIKRNQQAGVVIPSDRFGMAGEGELMYELSLLSTGGERQIGTNEVLQRYETRMAQTVLADFIQLGQTPNGTRSLAETKGSMFATAMGALLDSVASVINRHAIPRLLKLNGRPTDKCPQFVFDDIEYENVAEWTEALSKLAAAGMPIFPDPAIEAVVRAKLDLPEMTEEEIADREAQADAEKERAERQEEAGTQSAELGVAQQEQELEAPEEEEPPVEKADDQLALRFDAMSETITHALVELGTVVTVTKEEMQRQLDAGLLTYTGRVDRLDEKLSETAVALQGVCYEQEATAKRIEAIDGGIARVRDDLRGEVEAVRAELGTLDREERTAAVVAAAVAKAMPAPVIQDHRPTRKVARKLEDGTVEIVES